MGIENLINILNTKKNDLRTYFQKFITFFFLITFNSLFSQEITKDLLHINKKIENIIFQSSRFDFPKNFNEINKLIEQCQKIDYLSGEITLVEAKIQQAVFTGVDEVVYDMADYYTVKIEEAIDYGLIEKELHFKLLHSIIQISINGFYYEEKSLKQILAKSELLDNNEITSQIIFYLYYYTKDDEKEKYAKILEKYYSGHEALKKSFIYIAFMNVQAAYFLDKPPPTIKGYSGLSSQEEITLSFQARGYYAKEDFANSLKYSLEAFSLNPNNPEIAELIASNYLWLNNIKNDADLLDEAERYSLLTLELSGNYGYYNLACVYSRKNEIQKSLQYFKKALEAGRVNYEWSINDPDLENLRKEINLYLIIKEYDHFMIAGNYYYEAEKSANLMGLNRSSKNSNFLKRTSFALGFTELTPKFDVLRYLKDIKPELLELKKIDLVAYLGQIEDIWDYFIEIEKYSEAKRYLNDYIKNYESLFEDNEFYFRNVFSSSINDARSYVDEAQSFESYKGMYLSKPYNDLAVINWEESDNKSYMINKLKSIDHDEAQGLNNGGLVIKYVSVSNIYASMNEREKSKKYINKAEQILSNINDIDEIFQSADFLYDHYMTQSLEPDNVLFKKTIDLVNKLRNKAEKNASHQYHYEALLWLGHLYKVSNRDQQLQYDYFNKADSLLLKYKLKFNYEYSGSMVAAFSHYEEYDKVNRITENYFEMGLLRGDYFEAYSKGFRSLYTWAYDKSYSDDNYLLLKKWANRLKENLTNEAFLIAMQLYEIKIELRKNYYNEDYQKSLTMIDQYVDLKKKVISIDITDLTEEYILTGNLLLNHTSFAGNLEEFQSLLVLIEPLEWENSTGSSGTKWFMQFFDGAKGPFNEELYFKYIDKMLSYELDNNRLIAKIEYANIITNYYGQMTEAILLYEEALQEAKQLNDDPSVLEILGDLATRYGMNNQYKLSKRRFDEAILLATKLKDYDRLLFIYPNYNDYADNWASNSKLYDINMHYLNISKKQNSDIGKIQALSNLIEIFDEEEEVDSLIKYIPQGFQLKNSLSGPTSAGLWYLLYIGNCMYALNSDQTGELSVPFLDILSSGKPSSNSFINEVYKELIYLKDFDFSSIDNEILRDWPFIYNLTWRASADLKKYIDNKYLEKEDFDNMIDFLLNVDKKYEIWGHINAFWLLAYRIEKLDEKILNEKDNLYPGISVDELALLMEKTSDIGDKIIANDYNVINFKDFTKVYKTFLVTLPFNYEQIHDGEKMDSNQLIDLLNKYEKISTYGLVNEAINHVENIKSNALLFSEYNKYSKRINALQLDLQRENLPQEKKEELLVARSKIFDDLEYFEKYSQEKKDKTIKEVEFDFNINKDIFNNFDVVLRLYSVNNFYNGAFIWVKSEKQMGHFYTSTEEELKTKIKHVNNLIVKSATNEKLVDDLENKLLELGFIINGKDVAPWPAEELKRLKLDALEVLIITEGSYSSFPFELLRFNSDKDLQKYFYYGEYANITYAPSLNSFVHFSKIKQKNKSSQKALLVSANPETSSAITYTENLLSFRSNSGNIKFVDDEINAINKTLLNKGKWTLKRFSTDLLDSKSVNETKFKALDIGEYKYIHIAAHGVHDETNPKYSGLLLGRTVAEDGILQSHEIFPLNLSADLVTLSSCFSGFGEIDPDEGNLGIYRSFLMAGAKSVIISLWDVEDESTSILFMKFYEYLKLGNSKSESLRLAKMYLKNETRFDHPFFWAPFIIMGES